MINQLKLSHFIDAKKLLKEKRDDIGRTPKIGYEKIITGIDHSQHERMRSIIDIIQRLCGESTDGNADRRDITSEAEIEGLEYSKTERAVDRLRRNGQIYEPMHGKIRISE